MMSCPSAVKTRKMRSRNDQNFRLIVYFDWVWSPTPWTCRSSCNSLMGGDDTRSTPPSTRGASGAEVCQALRSALLHAALEEAPTAEEHAGQPERLARPRPEVERVALLD